MHTQGKWTAKRSGTLDRYIVLVEEPFGVIADIRERDAEANAKRIVQMNNSFDELLKACKEGLERIKHTQYHGMPVGHPNNMAMIQLEKAIAQAESDNT